MSKGSRVNLFIFLVTVCAIASLFFYLPHLSFSYGYLILSFLFVPFAFLAEIFEIELLPNYSFSVATVVYISTIYIGGIPLSLTIAFFALLSSELFNEYFDSGGFSEFTFLSAKHVGFNVAQTLVTIVLAGEFFKFVGGNPPPYSNFSEFFPLVLTFFVYYLINALLVNGVISLSEEYSFFYRLRFSVSKVGLEIVSMGFLSILVSVLYVSSPWSVALSAVILVLLNMSIRNYARLRKETRKTFEKITDLLSERDPYTGEHSESVGKLVESLSHEMGLREERIETIVRAARVHDIGKMGVPDQILYKPGELDEEEWEVMKEHPEIGAEILSGLEIYEDAAEIVRHEHERWDGSGYPDGLKGEEIPFGSRVVAVADVWDALTTNRPYRGPLEKEEALEEMEKMKGEELDPEIVEALFEVI